MVLWPKWVEPTCVESQGRLDGVDNCPAISANDFSERAAGWGWFGWSRPRCYTESRGWDLLVSSTRKICLPFLFVSQSIYRLSARRLPDLIRDGSQCDEESHARTHDEVQGGQVDTIGEVL